MKWLKGIVIFVFAVLALLAIIGLFLPSAYHVERELTIAAPAAAVHAYVGDLARWDAWTPWLESDPTIVVTMGATSTGVGAHQSWTGESGGGELTFTLCDPALGVAYDMSFDEGKYASTGELAYEAVAGGTRVVWAMDGDSGRNIIGRYFGLAMDAMVGPMFEDGLTRLKTVVESGADGS